MAISPPKTPELSSKLSHFKLTIKLLGGKLEELKNKNSDGDKRINKYLENNKEKNLNKKLVRFQAHFLT